jgi:NADPH-dependent ferric siderophore reductase
MRRVTLAGGDLRDFSSDLPGQWIKLFFDDGENGRAFTIRSWRREMIEMDVDFVVHEGGLAAHWLTSAKPGSVVRIAGPRSDFQHVPGKQLWLLGDETAVPAIAAILESLGEAEQAVVVIEARCREAVQPLPQTERSKISWIISDAKPGVRLAAHAKALAVNPASSQIWIGCEAAAARELRCAFALAGFDRSNLHASGYWKCGEIEHVDHESDY